MQHSINQKYESIGIGEGNRDNTYQRLSRHQYFMAMAYLCRTRSHDAQTQHGTIIVKDDRIISTGYNGFPAGMPDEIIPNIRPQKYPFVNHAEENAIYAAASLGIPLKNTTAYITGMPCHECARKLVSVGIKQWYIGDIIYVETEDQKLRREFWIEYGKVNVEEVHINH